MDVPPIFFSDYFGVSRVAVERYGAFDLNLLADVPLFVDPFLLFNSERPEYQALHDEILRYLRYLRTVAGPGLTQGTIKDLFRFQEVKQNWFGYCKLGNEGRGLGPDFANALNESITRIVGIEGEVPSTRSNHLEKVALLRPRVGKDNISDFATNLIKYYLVEYTEKFAKQFLDSANCREVGVGRMRFNFHTETWVTEVRYLPIFNGDYVLLTPANLLVHDETWINHSDMVRRYPQIVAAVDDDVLRDQVNRYFQSALGKNRALGPSPTLASGHSCVFRPF
ncbi:hypothetical protein [Rathayibacter rathayi]|nr:hypothetical protein [Rathayibacter rathayi]